MSRMGDAKNTVSVKHNKPVWYIVDLKFKKNVWFNRRSSRVLIKVLDYGNALTDQQPGNIQIENPLLIQITQSFTYIQ